LLSEEYLDTHKKLLQAETDSYDLFIFTLAALILLMLINIYYNNYNSLEPISSYLRLSKDFIFRKNN